MKLGKANEARRKAEAEALFYQMLKAGKKQVVTPVKHKGTRKANNTKAIRESRADG